MLRSNTRFILATVLMFILAVSPTIAQQRDSDGDGLSDADDNCPNQAGPLANKGCPFVIVIPSVDTDGDGLLDPDDNCPTVAGPRTNQGCPTGNPNDPPESNNPPSSEPGNNPDPVDTDGDGWLDVDDRCPTIPGTTANSGCPEDENPPFNPPILPTDACYVTPNGDFLARVRLLPSAESDHIGNLEAGSIYPAAGIINTSDGQWIKLSGNFQHLDFGKWGGSDGYVSDSVVNHSNCPTLDEPIATVDDLISQPQPQLCHLSVGFDSATWSDDPQVPNYVYASFWFASEPGVPLPVGTAAWGVIYVAPFITLEDANNVVVATTDPNIMQSALDSDYAGDFNWPTLAGAIVSGSQTLYRLSGVAGGNCGEIVGNDLDLQVTSGSPENDQQSISLPINQHACTVITAFNWIFAFNYAPGESIPVGTAALAVLNGDIENFGDASQWRSETLNLNDTVVEYMTYGNIGDAEYRSFPRTGGDCGRIGEPTIAFLRVDDQRYEPFGVQKVFVIETTGADCNNNGIDDLDEFWPPDCIGSLSNGDAGATEVPEETLDEVMEWLPLACGGGAWMVSLGKNSEGEVVVKNARCLD